MNYTTTTTFLPPAAGLPHAVIVGRAIRNVYIWVLVGVGLPGNLACLVTMLSMHVTSVTFYVALLAVVDSVALLLKLVFHQLVTHRKLTAGACTFFYVTPYFSCYANWVLVLIFLERFFTVLFPLKKVVYFTKTRIYVSVLVLTMALAVCFAPTPLFYTDVSKSRKSCVESKNMQEFKERFFDVFLACLYFFLPFILIAVFTTLIIIGLYRHHQRMNRMSISSTARGSGGSDGCVERSHSIMLLSAGLVFLLLTLPACMYHLFLKDSYDMGVLEEAAQSFLTYQIITLLSDTTHAVNFAIYCFSASRFRKRFFELLGRCFCRCRTQNETPTKSFDSEDAIRLTQVPSQSPAVEAEHT